MDKLHFTCKKYEPTEYSGGIIFLISAFKTKRWHYRPVISMLIKQGFKVYVYSYQTKALHIAHPEHLADFSSRIVAHITDNIAGEQKIHKASRFGIIGVSGGSMVALHAAKKCPNIEKIMLITVLGVTAQNVWDHPSLKRMKQKFESLNLGPDEVYQKFGYIEPTYRLDLIADRKMLIYANEQDPVIRYENTKLLIEAARKQHINLIVRHVKARRHSLTIIKVFREKVLWLPFFLSLKDHQKPIYPNHEFTVG